MVKIDEKSRRNQDTGTLPEISERSDGEPRGRRTPEETAAYEALKKVRHINRFAWEVLSCFVLSRDLESFMLYSYPLLEVKCGGTVPRNIACHIRAIIGHCKHDRPPTGKFIRRGYRYVYPDVIKKLREHGLAPDVARKIGVKETIMKGLFYGIQHSVKEETYKMIEKFLKK